MLAPVYITALTGLFIAWQQSRKKAKDEKRTIKITVDNRSYEGPVKDEEEIKKIISFLSEDSSS